MDGRMNGQKARSCRTERLGRKPSRAGKTGRGREDMNGLPEHEHCPREASYTRS